MGAAGPAGLVGRDRTWQQAVAAVTATGAARRATLLTGDAGVGKSALLAALADHFAAQGHRVQRATGTRSGTLATFSSLRDLLDGLPPAPDLPAEQRDALRAALAATGTPVQTGLLRLAVRSTLEAAAEDTPLLLALDDVDRLDEDSYDVLLPLLSRLPDGPVGLLATCRRDSVPRELGPVTDQLGVPALDDAAARHLLEATGADLPGRVREAVLHAAAGNPLVLVELARSGARDVPVTGVLPVPETLDGVFARDLAGLPPTTCRLLLLAACGERDVLLLQRLTGTDDRDFEPAERRRLVRLDGGVVQFRHPLVESHVYYAATAAERTRAHHDLAAALADHPDRAALQLAAAATGPDAGLADHVARVADGQRRSGRPLAGAVLFERAADLSTTPADRARRRLDAAETAAATGRSAWVGELLERVGPDSGDDRAAMLSAWLDTVQGDPRRSARTLLDLLRRRTGPVRAGAARSLGLPAFMLADPVLQQEIAAALPEGDDLRGDPGLLFAAAVCAPDAAVHAAVVAAGTDPGALRHPVTAAVLGAAASVLDEPSLAAELLREPVDAVLAGRAPAVLLSAPGALVWPLFDLGRWQEAVRTAVANLEATTLNDAPNLRAHAQAHLVIAELLRGHRDRAEVARADLAHHVPLSPMGRLRVAWADALAAAADGEHERAFDVLAAVLDGGLDAGPDDGTPGSSHAAQPQSLLTLPDLAAAARRTGRLERARDLVARTRAPRAGRWLTRRQELRVRAADALLLDDPAAAASALAPVVDAEGAGVWPLEQAVLQVELADLLLGGRRPGPAGANAAAAAETFERLGAFGWQRRVRTTLRASGTQVSADVHDVLAGLTTQQEQVVRMAAAGLSNRDIGEQLHLSPRTVASHLYRAFPRLGVATRAQLVHLLSGP